MDLLNESDLTRKEANARVDFASEDNRDFYPGLLRYSFGKILLFAKKLPPSVNGKTSTAHINGSTELVPLSNWDEIIGGYENWGVPEETDSHRLTRRMRTQCMYGWSKHEHEPYEQIQRMMAAPLERKMKEYSISQSEDEEFQKGASQLFFFLFVCVLMVCFCFCCFLSMSDCFMCHRYTRIGHGDATHSDLRSRHLQESWYEELFKCVGSQFAQCEGHHGGRMVQLF